MGGTEQLGTGSAGGDSQEQQVGKDKRPAAKNEKGRRAVAFAAADVDGATAALAVTRLVSHAGAGAAPAAGAGLPGEGYDRLSDELWTEVLLRASDGRSLSAAGCTCTELAARIKDDRLWGSLHDELFMGVSVSESDTPPGDEAHLHDELFMGVSMSESDTPPGDDAHCLGVTYRVLL